MKTKYAVIIAMSVVVSVLINACGTTSSLQKEREKMYKVKVKEYKQDGWKVAGTAKTLEVALLEHYEKLTQDNNRELVGEVSKCQSLNVCKQAAINNALVTYGNLAGSSLKGRIASDASLNQTTGEEFDKFYGAYERLVSVEIKGALNESYSIIKEDGKNKQYKEFFIVSEEQAAKARLRALELAAKETELAQKYARQITDFVREGFESAQ